MKLDMDNPTHRLAALMYVCLHMPCHEEDNRDWDGVTQR